jgi:hypothetical protein
MCTTLSVLPDASFCTVIAKQLSQSFIQQHLPWYSWPVFIEEAHEFTLGQQEAFVA